MLYVVTALVHYIPYSPCRGALTITYNPLYGRNKNLVICTSCCPICKHFTTSINFGIYCNLSVFHRFPRLKHASAESRQRLLYKLASFDFNLYYLLCLRSNMYLKIISTFLMIIMMVLSDVIESSIMTSIIVMMHYSFCPLSQFIVYWIDLS